jgi:monoamine oxidase
VVGAGVAGLACAAALRAAGKNCVLLEAASRIGGRAWTTMPAALHGAAFDHGASWLHAADRNPLLPIARAAREGIVDTDRIWTRQVMVDGRLANHADLAAYDRAEERFGHLIRQAAALQTDTSMAEAVMAMRENPWLATIETFEATLIAAADSRKLSVHDAAANSLEGRNLNIAGGLGSFVARRLAQPAWLETPVRRIAWNGAGVALDTPRGTLRARACVVTVSTGVLRAADGIAFDPELPASHRAALDALPMGVLTKVALGATGEDRLDMPAQCALRARVAVRHSPAMSFLAWPQDEAHVIGFVGGSTAEALSIAGPKATEAFARQQLRAMLGARADAALGAAVVADWAADPWNRGAYAYATPGHAGARAALAAPLAEGRMQFAGEAVATDGLAGTVGGAFESGQRAAALVLAIL